MLGALYGGKAKTGSPTVEQSKKYMKKFMNYDDAQIELLQEVYRHKLVHLAQPRPIILYHGKYMGWEYSHTSNTSPQIKLLSQKTKVMKANLTLEYDSAFSIGITDLVEDIKKSTEKYLDELKMNKDLRNKFERAFKQIYDYTYSSKRKRRKP